MESLPSALEFLPCESAQSSRWTHPGDFCWWMKRRAKTQRRRSHDDVLAEVLDSGSNLIFNQLISMSIYFFQKIEDVFFHPSLSFNWWTPPHPEEYIRPPPYFCSYTFPKKNHKKHFSTPGTSMIQDCSVEKKSPSSMEATELFESSDRSPKFGLRSPHLPETFFFGIPTKGYAAMLC